ncbi:hypothetical protein QQA02_03370 [Corynebacterium sp. MSK006]|uniref:hypothetical protein n=1 Tax=Corynebacterium sp. MSK006 TaxID=3050187 RepID=UPI0025512CE9|nr:hypothetical protein [Corynebacterium sp. MSK006]MDK8894745.1 hypothetical protein [Corynebacterium sp. MSK006]
MKLFTRKGIVTLGATVAIATTGIVAPAHAEESPAPETNAVYNSEKEANEHNATVTNSSDYACSWVDPETGKSHNVTDSSVINSLHCAWKTGGFEKQLGIITGFATLVTTVIGVASAVFNMAKKVAPDMF